MGHREIVIGTANPAKTQMVQSALLPPGMTVTGTDDLGLSLHIEADGKTAQEDE